MCGRSSLTTGKAGQGWGAASGDPYLLRVSEAEALRLVARQSGPAECDSAWSPDAAPHPCPAVNDLRPRKRPLTFSGGDCAGLAEGGGDRSAFVGEPLRDGGIAVAEGGAAGLEAHGG